MEAFPALLALFITGGFPSQRPVTLSFHVFFDLRLNKQSSKQSIHRWFETPSRSWWRHCNVHNRIKPFITLTNADFSLIKPSFFHHSWNYFPHDQARSRAYRWGEDGLLGITDRECRLCFGLALWNGKDPILKERLFGLTGPQVRSRESGTLQCCHNERDGVANQQPHDCLLKRLFKRKSKKTPKLRVTGLCEGNSPMTGEFPTQRTSNAENVSTWLRHHE